MKNETMEQKITELLIRDEPKEPRRCELGGGIYYKCAWLSCGEDINRFMNFCPVCGQRIGWGDSK